MVLDIFQCGFSTYVGMPLDDENRKASVMLFYFGSFVVFVAIIALLLCLDIVAVFSRLLARRLTRQKLQLDDLLVVPALVSDIIVMY